MQRTHFTGLYNCVCDKIKKSSFEQIYLAVQYRVLEVEDYTTTNVVMNG